MAPIKLSYIHLQEMVSVMLSLTSELDLKGKHYSISTVCVEFSAIKECLFKWGIVNPLSPNIHIQILQTDLHTFPLRIS